jgi:opacity protein-like surface antigen
MKKLILSFAIVAFAAAGVNAQVGFGIKGGLNISSLRGDDDEGLKSLIGGNAGFFANIPVSGMISLQPEVLYSLEGAQFDAPSDPKFLLNFINIPVMFKYSDPSGFYGELGPQIGIITSAKLKADGIPDQDLKENLKSTNFSLGLGAGWNFGPKVGVGVRYNLGLSNISEDDDDDLKTGNFSIGIHYSFGGSAAQ